MVHYTVSLTKQVELNVSQVPFFGQEFCASTSLVTANRRLFVVNNFKYNCSPIHFYQLQQNIYQIENIFQIISFTYNIIFLN
jgi:hypothetical protein